MAFEKVKAMDKQFRIVIVRWLKLLADLTMALLHPLCDKEVMGVPQFSTTGLRLMMSYLLFVTKYISNLQLEKSLVFVRYCKVTLNRGQSQNIFLHVTDSQYSRASTK